MVSWESSDATAMIAPAPMAITPKRRNGHARRHPKLRSFQGLPFFAKGRTLDLSTTTGSNAEVSVEWFWVTMDGLGDPDLLVSELLVGFSSARNSWAALQLSLVPNFRRSEEHTSELQSLMRISYAVFCLKKKKNKYLL